MTNLNGLKKYESTFDKKANCRNWQRTHPQKLVRASQPYYADEDQKHGFSKNDVEELEKLKIACVISVNHCKMTKQSKKFLGDKKIGFIHFEVEDFTAPTPQQLIRAALIIQMFSCRGATLVYCGAGQGRTGTFVAAWAMLHHLNNDNIDAMCNLDFLKKNFGVETLNQVNAIRHACKLTPITYTKPITTNIPIPIPNANIPIPIPNANIPIPIPNAGNAPSGPLHMPTSSGLSSIGGSSAASFAPFAAASYQPPLPLEAAPIPAKFSSAYGKVDEGSPTDDNFGNPPHF